MNTVLDYIKAARSGDINMLKDCLKHGVDIASYSNGALLESVYHGHLNIVTYLVESKIDINKNNGLELLIAYKNNKMNIFHYLLRKDIVENFKLESSFLSQDIKEKELFLEHNRQYLLEEGNYIKYALMKNDRSIIDWAEQQIKLQRVKNAFSEVLKKNKM